MAVSIYRREPIASTSAMSSSLCVSCCISKQAILGQSMLKCRRVVNDTSTLSRFEALNLAYLENALNWPSYQKKEELNE